MGQILLLGGDSDHNLGDDAILTALCQRLAARRPHLDLVITGRAGRRLPAPTVRDCIARGPGGLRTLLATARASEHVIVGGGGLFQDDDSRVKMPYWALRLALLRAGGANLAGLAIGAGPLGHAESRMTAGWSCRLLRRFSVRDELARRELQRCTSRPVRVVPDPAFMLTPAPEAAALDVLRSLRIPTDRPLMGVALRRWFHPLGGFVPHRVRASLGLSTSDAERRLKAFVQQIATAVRRSATQLDAEVVLLPTYTVAHEADHTAGAMLRAALPDLPIHEAVIDEPGLYKAVAGRLQLLLSARMHPMILAASMGVPVVGLAYNQKFAGLFGMLGLPERVTWIDAFEQEPEAMLARLDAQILAALADGTDVVARCAELAARTEQELLAIVDDRPAADGSA